MDLFVSPEVDFPGPAGGVRTPLLRTRDNGRPMLRFSFNLLTAGEYDPALDADVSADELSLGEDGRKLARRVSDLFHELRTSVLIPNGALLIWDNQRMLHARFSYADPARHLTRFWITDWRVT